MIFTASALMGSVTVNRDGTYQVDAYGDNWQKKPMDREVGDTRHFKHVISGLSKKKTSDIIIYPTPRG